LLIEAARWSKRIPAVAGKERVGRFTLADVDAARQRSNIAEDAVVGDLQVMGICFTQVGPTGCGFPGLSTSGWRMSAKGTGSIITAC
jgi:hypothetical protein